MSGTAAGLSALDPNAIFSAAGALVLLCWGALTLSACVRQMRRATWAITGAVAPGLLAIAYILLLRQGFAAGGGGFGSIAQVRALFANDAALAAGWLHYLAFDLFVGTWIARTGVAERVHPVLTLLCLPFTFMVGPVGLLLFFGVRAVSGRRATAGLPG